VVWLVAEFEAIIYQGTLNLIRGKNLKPALQRQLTIPHVNNRPFLFFGYLHSNINQFAKLISNQGAFESNQGAMSLNVCKNMKEVFFNPFKVH